MTMKIDHDLKYKNQEPGESRLAELIKEAGDDARKKRQVAMRRHFDRIREAVTNAVSQDKDAAAK